MPGPVNVAPSYASDIENFIADKTLPLAQRQLVAYQFADMETLPKGRGTTYTATRFLRVPLPFSPLSEGVPPVGQLLSINQVTAVAQQWGDKITLTDVAELTIKHPLIMQAERVMGYQIAETLERNTFNALMGGTQVNYVASAGSRNALGATSYMNRHEVQRAASLLVNLGAPMYMGDERTDQKIDAATGGAKSSNNPRTSQHYVAMVHPFVEQDMREDSTVVTAWSYSDLNKIYNNEIGELSSIRFCRTNMIPSFVGFANNANSLSSSAGNAGALAAGNYKIVVTGSDIQNQYESQIYAISGTLTTTGSNGSITVNLPTATGYSYNVYVTPAGGTSAANLGTSPSGPATGPQAGQAVQLTAGATVVVTGLGNAQVPPANPASGVTVYPTFIFGRGAYAQVELDHVTITGLFSADKSDPLNQFRVIGWKVFYGTLIKNNQFFMRIESSASNTGAFG